MDKVEILRVYIESLDEKIRALKELVEELEGEKQVVLDELKKALYEVNHSS